MEKKDDVVMLTKNETAGVVGLALIGAATVMAVVWIGGYKTVAFIDQKVSDLKDKRARKKAIQNVVKTIEGES